MNTRTHSYAHNPSNLHHEFSMLSLADLLEAREKNHVDLMRRSNVVGTAVGLYLIRRSDPWPPKETGSPGAVTRSQLPQNVACGFPALRSSEDVSQHCESL